MDLIELEPGCYTLPEDIVNPTPDGRKRDWHAQPMLRAGRYVVTVYEETIKHTSPVAQLRTINVRHSKERSYSYIDAHIRFTEEGNEYAAEERDPSGLATALAKHFVRDDSLEAALVFAAQETHVEAQDVILQLVAAGVLAEDTVRVTIAAVRRAMEAEWEAQELRDELKREKARAKKAS
jgi:hypothetical protein